MRLNAHLLYALFKHTFKTGMKNKGIGKIYLLAKRIAVGELATHYHADIAYTNPSGPFFSCNKTTDKSKYNWHIPYEEGGGRDGYNTGYQGGNKYHNNVQPSVGIYRFKRIS